MAGMAQPGKYPGTGRAVGQHHQRQDSIIVFGVVSVIPSRWNDMNDGCVCACACVL